MCQKEREFSLKSLSNDKNAIKTQVTQFHLIKFHSWVSSSLCVCVCDFFFFWASLASTDPMNIHICIECRRFLCVVLSCLQGEVRAREKLPQKNLQINRGYFFFQFSFTHLNRAEFNLKITSRKKCTRIVKQLHRTILNFKKLKIKKQRRILCIGATVVSEKKQ